MWFRSVFALWTSGFSPVRRSQPPRSPRPRLTLEQLEDRSLPSAYTAASVSDLIADINAANKHGGSNTITLVANTAFTLTEVDNHTDGPTGLPVITKGDNLTILGNSDVIERSTMSGAIPFFRLFDVASGAALTLENLTLQNGIVRGSGASAEGGAIYNQGTLVLSGVTVQGNSAHGSGGSLGTQGHPNGGPGQDGAGGGIWSGGALTLENGTVIQGNQAGGGMGGLGYCKKGGPYGYCIKIGGDGSGGSGLGGGLYVAGGTVSLTSATLSGNTAQGGVGGSGGSGFGGALYVAGGTVSLTSATLSGNTAQGIYYVDGGSGWGGALYVAGGTVSLTSTTLSGNTAQGGSSGNGFGGGLYAAGGTVSLCHDTVEFNTASGGNSGGGSGYGGGVYIAAGATVYLDDLTLVTTNTADFYPDIDGSYIPWTC